MVEISKLPRTGKPSDAFGVQEAAIGDCGFYIFPSGVWEWVSFAAYRSICPGCSPVEDNALGEMVGPGKRYRKMALLMEEIQRDSRSTIVSQVYVHIFSCLFSCSISSISATSAFLQSWILSSCNGLRSVSFLQSHGATVSLFSLLAGFRWGFCHTSKKERLLLIGRLARARTKIRGWSHCQLKRIKKRCSG